MRLTKLDNSFTSIFPESPKDIDRLEMLKDVLRIEKPGWQFDFLIRIGRADKYEYFYAETEDGLRVASGVLELPEIREILGLPDIEGLEELHKIKELDTPIESLALQASWDKNRAIVEEIIEGCNLPFPARPYQVLATIKSLTKGIGLMKMCTGSGKSFTISILLEYFRRQGLKGALIVPNINLLTQFASDIKSYNLPDLHKSIIKFGGGGKKTKEPGDIVGGELILTTWQSLKNLGDDLIQSLDYIICDEVHRFSSECTSKLVLDSRNAKYKLGFTGSIPKEKTSRMTLTGLFGMEFDIINSAELIEMGLGTPIKIHGIKLVHTLENSQKIRKYMDYLDRVKFIAKIEARNDLICRLSKLLASKSAGSTLILYTLIDHGVSIYKEITGEEPGDFERQKELGVFFMEGSVKAKEREAMRNAMDEMSNAIMIANYSLLSTGVNIKSLRYAIFASPLKSYTAIVQSLGRGIRVSSGKEVFEVYDLVDSFPGSISTFVNSSVARKKIYKEQKFEFIERAVNL